MRMFINGIGSVSPQRDSSPLLGTPEEYHARMLQCLQPDMDTSLGDKYLRRMSRLIRLGWIASKTCLDDAGQPRPDAIITGSGWGSVGDSEKFLLSIYRNKENFLPPTPFIQSTHNALGAQIAMLINSYDYNMSYAHSSFAFEHALLDSQIRLNTGESQHILCGGFDEVTPNQFTLWDRLGWWREKPANNLEILKSPSQGTISGESFNFFFLQPERTEKSYAEVEWVETIITDEVSSVSTVVEKIRKESIDLVVAGMNGDQETDLRYRNVLSSIFPLGVNLAAYKHLCGEHLTSSAYALFLAARIILEKEVPGIIKVEEKGKPHEIKKVLIYNHFKGKYHSFILLSRPDGT